LPKSSETRVGFFPRADLGCQTKCKREAHRAWHADKGNNSLFQCLKARVRVTKLLILDEAFGVICRTQQRLNGEKQRKQKGPVVTEVQIAVPPFFVSVCKCLRCAKTIAEIMSVVVTGKASAHRRPPKALRAKCYFGASEATIASKRGSLRSGSQMGS
jgi:hypothetical protein